MSVELASDITPPVSDAPATEPCTPTAGFRFRSKPVILQTIAILLGAAGFGWVLHRLTGDNHERSNWTLTVLLAGVSLMAGCWGSFIRWRNYLLPIRQLKELLPRVRAGECSIEELSAIQHGLSPLVPLIQDLVRDLRLERTHNAELQADIRQRVHNRTDALERKIGSLQQQATRDALTGLHNRRLLDQQLPVLIERCKEQYLDLTVLMIDVDYFKTLNDTLGHAAGDLLLRQIAQLMRSTIRNEDTAFRCGGDEFVIIMPGISIETGVRLADRLRSLVDSLGKTLKVPRAPRLSIGVASLHSTNVYDPAELLKRADKALYDVKAARPGSSRVA